jgi:hypothetical protein
MQLHDRNIHCLGSTPSGHHPVGHHRAVRRFPRAPSRVFATKQADAAALQPIVQIKSGQEVSYSSVDGRLSAEVSQAAPLTTQQATARLKALFLPDGYPSSVTDDYLAYQLWTVPAHITGWLSHSLTTSSLLKAVGISAGPLGATAAAAAIKWILKDGIGAMGRYLVGGRLGLEFDADPRRWRMVAGEAGQHHMVAGEAGQHHSQHNHHSSVLT